MSSGKLSRLKASGGDGALGDLLNPAHRLERRTKMTVQPPANSGVADADQFSELGQGELVMIEVLPEVHGVNCALYVHSEQVLCAALAADSASPSGQPFRMHEHLRAWRTASGLTLKEVGNKIGTTHATVSRWEAGVQAIPPNKFRQLAAVYGATPAELLVAPADRSMALRFHRAAEIIGKLSDGEVEQWLGLGHSLADAKKR
jgi:transcriptional regulator with XRE-family HTH domain